MSVVVRMDMPENCCECQLRQEDFDTGEEFCPFTGVECLSIGRQNNCPILCQLPEGHGRIIDADEFLKRAIGTQCFRGDYSLMLEELVAESTTIVPAERSET